MDKLFEEPIFDAMYELRGEELENIYAEKYGEPKERKQKSKAEDELLDSISKIPEEELKEKIMEKYNHYSRLYLHESEFWRLQSYKNGFGDCICLVKELLSDVPKERNIAKECIQKISSINADIHALIENTSYTKQNIENLKDLINSRDKIIFQYYQKQIETYCKKIIKDFIPRLA